MNNLRGCKNFFGEVPKTQKIRAWFRRVKQNSVNFSLRDNARLGEIRRDWASLAKFDQFILRDRAS